jgi:hypothetical protein
MPENTVTLAHTKMAVLALDYFFLVCRKILIPTWKEPF